MSFYGWRLFIQPSVRIRNLEKNNNKSQFERLYEADDLQDSIKHLNETVYSEDLAKIDKAENFWSIFQIL